MGNFFSPDSKFMNGLNMIADLMFLNILFVISCIPIFTIGAATTAMYTVTFRMGTEREGPVTKTYFHAFRQNFKQSTLIMLMLLLFFIPAFADFIASEKILGFFKYLKPLFALILLVISMTSAYVFPVLSQFENTIRMTIRNAMVLSIAHLPRTVLIVFINMIPLLVFYFLTPLFFRFLPVWMFIFYSLAAYFISRLMKKVFARFYEPAEEEASGEEGNDSTPKKLR